MVKTKRAYDPPGKDDGYRVLVDRLWPRGVRKEEAAIDAWFRDIAPSADLRKWFSHDPERWPEFARRYEKELKTGKARELLEDLEERAAGGTVTLVYAARDEERNNAAVLKKLLGIRYRS
jgi:uncharacterized protein YeaO (DUF488 family)